MGLAASHARLLMLVARKSDLELQLQIIAQSRQQLSNVLLVLQSIAANLEPDSPQMQEWVAKVTAIQALDKSLELQSTRMQLQQKLVSDEVETVKKVQDKAAEMAMKYIA
ncbi:MAG: hypothetical protein ACKO37_09440 [Vampirovibrionales bacterium]|jgi:hypothetical protein